MTKHILASLTLSCLAALSAGDGPARPYVLWSAQELSALRSAVAAQDASTATILALSARLESANQKAGGNQDLLSLLRAVVNDDAGALAANRRALAQFAAFQMPVNKPGDPGSGNAAWREDRTLDALRYDALYSKLTAEERAACEKKARELIEWCIANPGPWHQHPETGARSEPRTGWLPNMQWPTMAGAHVWAVALGDRDLIERLFNANGGWKWYFDVYLADNFYMEEFAKTYSNIGAKLWWCEGLSRLGLDQFGWNYTAPNGNTMRRYLNSLIRAGLPGVRDERGRFDFSIVYMGDAGREFIASDTGFASQRWSQARMNGVISKARQPLWWELGHKRFPEDGYGFFLAQLAEPGKPYVPSPWWALPQIDPATVRAPSAPSFASRERGFAVLRAEESPAYWTSPKPAVAVQFGMYYVHYMHDAFSILDFVAGNQYLYDKSWRTGSGYGGGDAYRDHGRGQCSAVVVDDLKNRFVDNGSRGAEKTRVRDHLSGPAKFLAIRADGIYPQVVYERAYVLSDAYLLDIADLKAQQSRVFDWHVNALGLPENGGQDPWTEPAGGNQLPLEDERRAGFETFSKIAGAAPRQADGYLSDIRIRAVEANDWSQAIRPTATGGVRVWMLGEAGTVLSNGRPPLPPINPKSPAPPLPVGTKLMASRSATATRFVAVHEPLFGTSRIASLKRISSNGTGTALRIVGVAGSGIDDLAVVNLGDAPDSAATYASSDGTISITTTGFAWLRASPQVVMASGNLSALTMPVNGTPVLTVNGATVAATVTAGVLRWQR